MVFGCTTGTLPTDLGSLNRPSHTFGFKLTCYYFSFCIIIHLPAPFGVSTSAAIDWAKNEAEAQEGTQNYGTICPETLASLLSLTAKSLLNE